jgi:hypothetical protein
MPFFARGHVGYWQLLYIYKYRHYIFSANVLMLRWRARKTVDV